MTFKLIIFTGEYGRGHHAWNHFRFAVVDLNKSESYPENFVSMLPMRLGFDGKLPSAFTNYFGNKSAETARGLLTAALKKEHSSEVVAEIERRLTLLEPNPTIHVNCRVCKKFFQTTKETTCKQKICPECLKRFDRRKIQKSKL